MKLHCNKSSLQKPGALSACSALPFVAARPRVTGAVCPHKRDRIPGVAEAVPHAMATQSATMPQPKRTEQEYDSRKILLAVDGTDESVKACSWMLESLCRPGDMVHLCHVVCNERVAPTSVGASGYGGTGGRNVMASVDEDFGRERRIEYLQRKEQEANNMLASRFMPLLFNGQVRYQVDLVVADGLRSAATIGETIVRAATRLNTDILVIASHGTGLLADYGSVARYCTQHFRGALILVPPCIEEFKDRGAAAVCCGVNTESEVATACSFTLEQMARPDDTVHVLHAFEERLVATGSNDNAAIHAAVSQQVKTHVVKDVKVTHLPMEPVLAGDEKNKHSAQQVLQAAADSRARALVLVNYATQGMMQEMMLGSLAMHCSRSASLPLVLIPPGSF